MKRETTLKYLLLITVLFCLSGCAFRYGAPYQPPPPIPNVPRTYNTEYNKVWNSALDVLDEEGYVIAQMDKADGYITTDRKAGGSYRDKVSLRIVDVEGEVTVRVNLYNERGFSYTDRDGTKLYSWYHYSSDGSFEKQIKDKIAEKLGLAR